MFISPAFAQGVAGDAGGGLASMLPLVLIFVVFYFLLIRPQQKKMKQHKEMLGSVRRGDKIVTGGGIVATVSKVNDATDELTVEIAENVKVKIKRSTILENLAKTEPAPAANANTDGGAAGDGDGGEKKEGPVSGIKKLLGGK